MDFTSSFEPPITKTLPWRLESFSSGFTYKFRILLVWGNKNKRLSVKVPWFMGHAFGASFRINAANTYLSPFGDE